MKRKILTHILLVFGFLLGISEGKIALWKDGRAEPVRVFPYRAELLPEADQKALARGIHLEDENQLAHLLEDYLS